MRIKTYCRELVKSDRGWTFIETLVVLAVILILTATVGVSSLTILERAKVAAARSQIEIFCMALNSYYIDCGTYPSDAQGLTALWERPLLEPVPDGWAGPYVTKSLSKDPWGAPYCYSRPGPGGLPFGIKSFGRDGIEGMGMNSDDITSWGEEDERR
jgi:general secretion pathway protein G